MNILSKQLFSSATAFLAKDAKLAFAASGLPK